MLKAPCAQNLCVWVGFVPRVPTVLLLGVAQGSWVTVTGHRRSREGEWCEQGVQDAGVCAHGTGHSLLSIPGRPGTGLAALFQVGITLHPSPSPNHALAVPMNCTAPSSPSCRQRLYPQNLLLGVSAPTARGAGGTQGTVTSLGFPGRRSCSLDAVPECHTQRGTDLERGQSPAPGFTGWAHRLRAGN